MKYSSASTILSLSSPELQPSLYFFPIQISSILLVALPLIVDDWN
jgi:hypothetical protein